MSFVMSREFIVGLIVGYLLCHFLGRRVMASKGGTD